jgi:hypothetical protein
VLGLREWQSKKSKKTGKQSNQELLETFDEPIIEVEPAIEVSSGALGVTARKSKKKKGGTTFESVNPVAEALPPPSESEAIIEDAWFYWGSTNKKSKKTKGKCLEVHIDPAPEPKLKPVLVDALETPTKKGEKMRSVLKPEPDEWAQFSASNRSEKDEWGEPEVPLGEELSAARKSSAEVLDVPPATEPVQHPDVATLLAQATSTETPTHNTQLSTPRSGQTVIFTIQLPEEVNMKPLQAMITLADNTRAAILEAVHSYIDSKSSLMYNRGLRRLEIKSGAGKKGEVDLSTLEETMWPEYLEYFRQYTKLPELTIDCLHC